LRRNSTVTSNFRLSKAVVLLGLAALLASCQRGKMPEEGSYAAQLYVKRCGQCHQPYNPSLMTATMWAVQVDRMQERMKQVGISPLTPDQRKTILDYLSSNAGKQ
jgi:diheme cytochrome c